MSRNFTFLLLFVLSAEIFAQTPGYLGNKWVVYGSAALSPALYGRYLDDDVYGLSSVSKVGINCRFDVYTDYTVSKGVAIGTSFKHISTKLPFSYYTTDINSDLSPYDKASFLGDINLNANFGSIYFKFFPFQKKGVIAPVGHYNKFEFIFGQVKGSTGKYVSEKYDNDASWYQGDVESLVLPEFEDLNYQYGGKIYGLMYSFGNTWAFTDKLLFDFSTQFGYLFQSNLANDFSSEGHSGDAQYYYEQNAIDRVQGTFLMNFNFGFGYLIL